MKCLGTSSLASIVDVNVNVSTSAVASYGRMTGIRDRPAEYRKDETAFELLWRNKGYEARLFKGGRCCVKACLIKGGVETIDAVNC